MGVGRGGTAAEAALPQTHTHPLTHPPPLAFHPRGLKKEQKDELAAAEKVLEWVTQGKDIR